MKLFLRNLTPGQESSIEEYSLYMRAKLLVYLALLSVGIASFFFLLNVLYYQRTAGNIQYMTVIVVSGATLYLTRLGHHTFATLLHLLMVNSIVFYFSYYDYLDANYQYFLCNALASLVLLGYQRRWLVLGVTVFTMMLFLIAYTGFFGYYDHPYRLHPLYNFIFVFLVCAVVLYYLLRLHDHAEKITRAKNAQLQKANAELDRFVYSASHDLRAPLSSLLGLIELARKSDNRQEVESYLSMMKGRIHHLDDFIKEIIDYSRNERMEVVRQPIDLYKLVEEVIANLINLEGANQINIQNEVPRNLVILNDTMRLRIVVNNLLNNAIKYHDHNKETRYILISVIPKVEGLHFTVSDNGMGIPAEHQDKIFNMFYRASDKSKGSGLGLYIVKESLGQLGGSVSLKSVLGEGSTFIVQLPA